MTQTKSAAILAGMKAAIAAKKRARRHPKAMAREHIIFIARCIINADKEPTYGLHRKKQMPFFRMLKKEIFGDAALNDDGIASLVSLTQQVFGETERELKLTGFWESIPARNKLKADIQKTLLQPEFAKLPDLVKNRAHIISRIMEIAEKNNDTILYAP
jgi:type I restriction enzyme, R subunit